MRSLRIDCVTPRTVAYRASMRIIDAIRQRNNFVSFEVFPPKESAGLPTIVGTLRTLGAFEPAYASVTYGAGGGTSRFTIELARRIERELRTTAMTHLTCVGTTSAEIDETLDAIADAGIRNVLALRGDPPKG